MTQLSQVDPELKKKQGAEMKHTVGIPYISTDKKPEGGSER